MHPLEAWRHLELPPSPTVEQVKAAYRRLAKAQHPDLVPTGGRTAAPARFARLTAAYESALSEAVAANRHGPRPTPPRADPAPHGGERRDDATRAAAPSRHAARTASDATAPRATPGSTTYPVEPYLGDPAWGGAEWVGAHSGTYWTVNPKEYADPRRHGPEYRARGRRPVRREARGGGERRVDQQEQHEAPRRGLFAWIAAILARRGTINE